MVKLSELTLLEPSLYYFGKDFHVILDFKKFIRIKLINDWCEIFFKDLCFWFLRENLLIWNIHWNHKKETKFLRIVGDQYCTKGRKTLPCFLVNCFQEYWASSKTDTKVKLGSHLVYENSIWGPLWISVSFQQNKFLNIFEDFVELVANPV